jgi:drug/metabolite transporter (DMT)-like permease
MFYTVIAGLGAARASMVTYVIPIVAVTLGAVFLDEIIDASLLMGAALIFTGLALVNGWLWRRKPAFEKIALAKEAKSGG